MDERLEWSPSLQEFAPVCISDCFASQGILFSDSVLDFAVTGNCMGSTDGGLGGLLAYGNKFLMTFTAPNPPNTYGSGGTDVAFVALDSAGNPGTVVWLTNTNGINEKGSHLTPYGPSGNFLVGWYQDISGSQRKFFIAVIDSNGNFVDQPEEITSTAIFNEREPDWVTFANGDAGWVAAWDSTSSTPWNYVTALSSFKLVRVSIASTSSSASPAPPSSASRLVSFLGCWF